jgi:hypothetical protein
MSRSCPRCNKNFRGEPPLWRVRKGDDTRHRPLCCFVIARRVLVTSRKMSGVPARLARPPRSPPRSIFRPCFLDGHSPGVRRASSDILPGI